MPEVVKTNLREPRPLQERLERAPGEVVAVEGLACLGGEYEAVLVPQGADPVYLRELALWVTLECLFGPARELYASPGACRLRGREDGTALGNGKRPANLDGAVFEVYIVPL